jgi:hypothetical protein
MAEAKLLSYDLKQIAEILVKERGITEGNWGVYVKFGLQAGNVGPSPTELYPAAIVPLMELGIQRFDVPNSLTVDAAKLAEKKPAT